MNKIHRKCRSYWTKSMETSIDLSGMASMIRPQSTAVENHSPGVRVIIPPREDAVPSPTVSTAPTQRDQHLLEIERTDRLKWKRTSGYYDQSRAESAFSRFKRLFGGRLRAKRDEGQEREASLDFELLNRMRAMSRPLSYPVS